MKITRLSGALGASIEGIDIRNLGDDEFAKVRDTFFENAVLVIRNQHLKPDDHLAFAGRFGNIQMTSGTEKLKGPNTTVLPLEEHPQVLRIRNLGKKAVITEAWHADNCHVERPTSIAILAAQDLPSVGGDTIFANQYLAYDELSSAMKRMLRGLKMLHFGDTQPGYNDGKTDGATIPRFHHPVVRTNPDTGRRALFIGGRPGRGHGDIEGLKPAESLALHQFLLHHATEPHFCYRHRWMDGDVLLWDNRCTLHYAVHDYGDAVRK